MAHKLKTNRHDHMYWRRKLIQIMPRRFLEDMTRHKNAAKWDYPDLCLTVESCLTDEQVNDMLEMLRKLTKRSRIPIPDSK